MATRQQVIAWLDAKGWPHDPYELTKDQNLELRTALRICGHRNKRHEPCAFPPMANGRCKYAGGPSRKGASHPNYKGKGRSKYLRGAIRDRYKDIDEAGLLDLTDQLRIMAARETMLLERLDPAETGQTWKALKQELGGLQAALRAADRGEEGAKDQVLERLLAIQALVGRGASDAEAWEELTRLWELARRTVDTEVKRRVMYKLFIKAEDATQDYDAMANAIKDTVDDFVRRGLLERRLGDRLLTGTSDRFAHLVTLPGLPPPAK